MTRALAQKLDRAPRKIRRQRWSLDEIQHLMLDHVSWELYEHLLKEIGDRPLRLTYDQGDLEIMAPSGDHEEPKTIVGRLIETLTEELSMRCLGGGSTTFKSKPKAKGLEPDECYYLGIHATPEFWKGKRNRPPLPDLAIEVDYTSRSIPRMPIYAKLGIPQVWRLHGNQIDCLRLSKTGSYEKAEHSLAFPMLRPVDLTRFIKLAEESRDQTSAVKTFRKWVRKQGWVK